MKKKIITFCAAVLFLTALGLTLYPLISNYVNQKYASEIQTAYQELIQQTDDSVLQEAKQRAVTYNLAITPGTADAYSEEALVSAAEDYDSQLDIAGSGIMGYVEIPKIQVNLPIYHGTEAEVLDRGVGHLLGSSLPVGGKSTHTILSGHSGMASQKMFTDLEQLTQGDVFYLNVLNETLAYQVTEINTVLPYETDLLGNVPGEDLCTLVTCTPYGVNTHRLLVRGSRIPYEEAAAMEEETASVEPAASTWEAKYLQGLLIGCAATVGVSAIVFLVVRIKSIPKPAKEATMRKLESRGAIIILMLLVFLAGLASVLYPYVWGAAMDISIANTAKDFLARLEENPDNDIPTVIIPSTEPEESRPYPELWDSMATYNQQIYTDGQSTLSEAGAYQAALFTLTGYGLPDETFGVISIPKLDLEMPLYLGATDENMAKGAAVLSGTSIPIGGSNTNAVIAGHRGWGGAAYFRYITDLAVGDEVIITNLWERLRYRVVGTKIIEPHEIEDILIQPGRDMVTLLTCHPYASGGKQRYLVYCQRIQEYDIMEVRYD